MCPEYDWLGRFDSVSIDGWAENGSWSEAEGAKSCLWSLKTWIGSIGAPSEGGVPEDYDMPSWGAWLPRLVKLYMHAVQWKCCLQGIIDHQMSKFVEHVDFKYCHHFGRRKTD